ncbi:MAG TPA: hypothetical protein VG276_17885 [Actinomycetes bacterium]|jgi:hypothetical protein|nr:hypothetical protein [Actinomycetes bacterium]
MNVGLVVAGSLCLVLAAGHTLTGRLVLDRLPRNFQPTRFGDGAYARGLLVFTWHALSLMLTTTGAVLIALAQGAPADDRGQVVFLLGAAYAAAAVVLAWMTRRRPSDLLRIPVWAPFIAIIVLCWLNT